MTWIGVGGSVLLGGLAALTGGFWSMLVMCALVVLLTAMYGLIFRRTTWLRLPRKRTAAALGAGVAFAVLLGSVTAYGAAHPASPTPPDRTAAVSASPAVTSDTTASKKAHTPTPTPTPTPVVTTRLVTETVPVPFTAKTVTSAAQPKDTSSVTTIGVNGVETKTYTVTYVDGVETARVLSSDVVTTQPVPQVTTVGTYVAPPAPAPPAAPAPVTSNCTNGTYVNTAGNTVCRPEVSSSAPSGATARCTDGAYSFSQTRRGTCSSHGGVAEWL